MTMREVKFILSVFSCIILLASWMHGERQERIFIQTPFKPIKKVYPDYPEILKKEGVAARMLLTIRIDREGNVERASAWSPLYPELEENFEEAFSQWKFEPFIHKGKPIRAFGLIMVIFFPGKLITLAGESESTTVSLEDELAAPYNQELQMVLDKCAEYCLKLSESALYYVCHEEMREKLNKIKGPEQEVGIIPPDKIFRNAQALTRYGAYYIDLALRDTEKNVFIYDYQLIRKDGHIKEKRILMEKDGKSKNQENVSHRKEPPYNLKPILAPIRILSIEQRSKFSFRLADDEKIKGKPVYVIETCLRPGQPGNIKRGKIWVDKSDFRIVKAEVETEFVEGCEQMLSECYHYYLKPHFKSTYYYEVDKNGILFPSKSEIRAEYSGFLNKKRKLKSEVKITYRNYKFFTVKTDHEIIKKKLEALSSNHSNLTIKNSIRLLPCVFKHFF